MTLPWVGDWLSRPLPLGGSLAKPAVRGVPTMHLLELGHAAFDRWFYLFAADDERTRALLGADVADAMASAEHPQGYLWFDGIEIDLLRDLEGQPDPSWIDLVRDQRELAGHIAATIAARVARSR